MNTTWVKLCYGFRSYFYVKTRWTELGSSYAMNLQTILIMGVNEDNLHQAMLWIRKLLLCWGSVNKTCIKLCYGFTTLFLNTRIIIFCRLLKVRIYFQTKRLVKINICPRLYFQMALGLWDDGADVLMALSTIIESAIVYNSREFLLKKCWIFFFINIMTHNRYRHNWN